MMNISLKRNGVVIDEIILCLLGWSLFLIPASLEHHLPVGLFDGQLAILLMILIVSLYIGLNRLNRFIPRVAIWLAFVLLSVTAGLIVDVTASIEYWLACVAVIGSTLAIVYIKQRGLMVIFGWMLLLVLVLHAQWGVAQFVLQGDLNLRLLGESVLQIGDAGIATFGVPVDEGSIKVLRAYGPYSHPNIFAGMMVLGLILLFSSSIRRFGSIIPRFLFGLMLAAIFLSFSRLAVLSLLLTGIVYIMCNRKIIMVGNSGSWSRRGVAGILIAIVLFAPLWWWRMNDVNDVAVSERLIGYAWSIELLKETPGWLGVGLGNYPEALGEYLQWHEIQHEPWQVDYVHSVPILMLVELGPVLGFFTILIIAGGAIIYLGRLWWWLIPIIPLLLWDHYLLTEPALQLMLLWVVLILPQLKRTHLPVQD